MATNPTWEVQLNHPHLSGQLTLRPLMQAAAGEGTTTTPVQLGLSLTSSHPQIQAALQALGPVLAQVLPIVLDALLASAL